MVATKKSPLQEGNFDVRRSGGSSSSSVTESRLNLTGELGGVIFICNNDTMDLERGLFEGLPQRYQDLVRAIQPGMPLFLYNYSTRKLYGVYEAASNGALNIEPDAWAESRDNTRNGKPVSKYPAQVRMRLRQERPPLEEDKFRPYLRHYEYPKFKLDLTPEEVTLELTREEAENLLRLFGMDEENGGGWQTVRGNKPNRSHHVPINPQSGRRRPAPVPNGTGANGSPALTGLANSAIDGVTRPGSRADTAHRWRTDSDSWSGSSSAGTVSSSWTLHEEDRPKKSYIPNGVIADAMGPTGEEKGQDSRSRRTEHVNGNFEVDREAEAGTSFIEGTYSNGVEGNVLSSSAARGSSSKPGFASYSAAVKAGIPTGAIENSGWESLAGSSTDIDAVPSGSRTDNGKPSSTLSTDVSSSESLADKNQKSSANGSSRSPKGDVQGIWVAHSKQKAENGPRRSEELSSRQQAGAGLDDERASCSDGDVKISDRTQPWIKPGALPKSPVCDFGNRNGGVLDSKKPTSQVSRDLLAGPKVQQNDDDTGEAAAMAEEQDVEVTKGTSRKVGWHTKDAHWRLQDTDPAVGRAVMNGGSAGLKEKLEPAGTSLAVPGGDAENERTPATEVASQKQQGHPSEQLGQATSSHGSKAQSFVQHSRPAHEVRRSQFEYQKHERHLEDRPGHYRKQLPVDHSQIPPISQARQHGHNLAPIRVPTSPPPLMQQQQHPYPVLSNTNNVAAHMYRERSHGRGVRIGGGSGEGAQVQAYRPISARAGLDGDMGLLSPISPVSAGTIPPTPVPPSPASTWTFPSQIMSPTFAVPGYPPFHVPQVIPTIGIHPNVEILHSEILEYARSATPTAEARRRALAAVDCVREGVKQLWKDADVEMFGSFATGLCLCHSDVDVVVLNTPPPSYYDIEACAHAQDDARALFPLVRDLAAALQPLDWCLSLETITAKVPLLQLKCLPDGKATDTNTPVKMDITIGGRSKGGSEIPAGLTSTEKSNYERFFVPARNLHNGLKTSSYVCQRLRQLPALAPLALLLKSYLHMRGLNIVYNGGLGSFSLTLMLVFYLEQRAPPFGMRQELPGRSFPSAHASIDTHSASSCEEVDEADDNISTSSYSSTGTSASSSSNEGTAKSGDSNSASSSRTFEGHISGDNLQGSAGGSFEELWALMQTVPAPTLGVLLLGFLRMFESIDLSKVKFVLKGNGSEGGVYPCHGSHLWIDDPLRPGKNVGAGSFLVREVQKAMGDMLTKLTQVPTVNGTERVEMGPGRRRPLVLLDQLFPNSGPSSS